MRWPVLKWAAFRSPQCCRNSPACLVLFVRKKAKEYGTCKIAEGGQVRGRKLLIVEDVVTSGGAILDAAKALREEGALLSAVVCVIDRESGGPANLAKADLILTPLFTMTELKKAGA